MTKFRLARRQFLGKAALGLTGLGLSGCTVFDGLDGDGGVRNFLEGANALTIAAIGAQGESKSIEKTIKEISG